MHKICKTSQHLSNMVRYRYDKEIYRTIHFSKKRQCQNSAFKKFGNLLNEKTSSEITRSKNRFGALWTARTMTSDKPLDIWKDYLNRWKEQYSNFVGIKNVKKAQERVTELTNELQALLSSRKVLQQDVDSCRVQLLANQKKINITKMYSEENFAFHQEAFEINNILNEVQKDFDQCESDEKETFGKLSSAMRDFDEIMRSKNRFGGLWTILYRWNEQYSNIVGITDVKKAQERVTELENKLQELQSYSKVLQRDVDSFTEQLQANHQNYDRTKMYSIEHSAIHKEGVEIENRLNEVRKDFDKCERDEKETSGKLTSAIRDCHEQYSNSVCITDTKKAQERVTELENKLQELQRHSKDLQLEEDSFREQLLANFQKSNRTRMYSIEHSAIYKEGKEINNRLNEIRKDFDKCERDEKETFGKLTSTLRDCHEQSSNFVVITDTKKAQERVTELENKLQELQSSRKVLQLEVDSFRVQLLANQQNYNITKMYLIEHSAISKERVEIENRLNEGRKNLNQCEIDEKETSAKLSIARRDWHAHQLSLSEKFKSWGFIVFIVSCCITCITTLYSFLTNRLRIKEIKEIIEHVTLSNKMIIDQNESQQRTINEMKEDSIALGKQLINETVLTISNSLNSQQTVPDNDLSSVNSFPNIAIATAVGAVVGAAIQKYIK